MGLIAKVYSICDTLVNVKSALLHTRVSTELLEQVKADAKHAGFETVSDYVRDLLQTRTLERRTQPRAGKRQMSSS